MIGTGDNIGDYDNCGFEMNDKDEMIMTDNVIMKLMTTTTMMFIIIIII